MKIWKWYEYNETFRIDVPVYRFPYLAFLLREVRYHFLYKPRMFLSLWYGRLIR